jgi:hypothetical protein
MAVDADERTQVVNELLGRIGETVGQKAQVSTIFGDPVEREGVTVIANRMSGLQLLGRRIRTGERQVGDSAGRGDGLDLVVVL